MSLGWTWTVNGLLKVTSPLKSVELVFDDKFSCLSHYKLIILLLNASEKFFSFSLVLQCIYEKYFTNYIHSVFLKVLFSIGQDQSVSELSMRQRFYQTEHTCI